MFSFITFVLKFENLKKCYRIFTLNVTVDNRIVKF